MIVGFEDTTENKKWLVPQRNKNIRCFFSDSNKSEHQDKCLGWRMLTSSIGSSETQLTLKHTPKDLAILFLLILFYLERYIAVYWTISPFFVSGQKNVLLQSWIDWRMISVILFWSTHKIFSKQRSIKKVWNVHNNTSKYSANCFNGMQFCELNPKGILINWFLSEQDIDDCSLSFKSFLD